MQAEQPPPAVTRFFNQLELQHLTGNRIGKNGDSYDDTHNRNHAQNSTDADAEVMRQAFENDHNQR
jgi:hypothetical protein